MYREDFIKALRYELLEMVERHLTPIARRSGYSEAPLETNIRWRPMVLVLGNYSSGKSALINEFLGADIQTTGQAPTDDSFTVLTYGESTYTDGSIHLVEERDGKYLISDPEYPFQNFKRHGQRFAAHFRLKKINAPILENFAIIDTPGMLDSIAEKDRGYNYHAVIGDFAQIADLILVLFDAHKAGTIRETHISLRDTLPAHTFEDRVLFALNRVDECTSLMDLVRVYGTLCWNLSQITGRKDIPHIRLTYSPQAVAKSRQEAKDSNPSYLEHLENQREDLKKAILEAPRHRLDNLAAFVETHAERLTQHIHALTGYGRARQRFFLKQLLLGLLPSCGGAAGATLFLMNAGLLGWLPPPLLLAAAGGLVILFLMVWMTLIYPLLTRRFHEKQIEGIDNLARQDNQHLQDTWSAVRETTIGYLKKTEGKFSLGGMEADLQAAQAILEQGTREVREAINELSAIHPGERVDNPPGPFLSALAREMAESGIDYPD